MTMEGQDRILDRKAMADQCARWREAGGWSSPMAFSTCFTAAM